MNIEYFLNLPTKEQIALGSAAAMLIAVILDLFLAYRKLERMERYLDQCSLLNTYKHLLSNSLRGSVGQAMRGLCRNRSAAMECKTWRR